MAHQASQASSARLLINALSTCPRTARRNDERGEVVVRISMTPAVFDDFEHAMRDAAVVEDWKATETILPEPPLERGAMRVEFVGDCDTELRRLHRKFAAAVQEYEELSAKVDELDMECELPRPKIMVGRVECFVPRSIDAALDAARERERGRIEDGPERDEHLAIVDRSIERRRKELQSALALLAEGYAAERERLGLSAMSERIDELTAEKGRLADDIFAMQPSTVADLAVLLDVALERDHNVDPCDDWDDFQHVVRGLVHLAPGATFTCFHILYDGQVEAERLARMGLRRENRFDTVSAL